MTPDPLIPDRRPRETETQARGNAPRAPQAARATCPARMPSVVAPLPGSPDANVLINALPDVAAAPRAHRVVPFALAARRL